MTSSKNRFDPTIGVPEINYLIIIALWLHGQTTTEISKQSTIRPPWLGPLLMRLVSSDLIDEPITSYSVEPISRQKCHQIISNVSKRILISVAGIYENAISALLDNPENIPEEYRNDKEIMRTLEIGKSIEQKAFRSGNESPLRSKPKDGPNIQLFEQMAWEVITGEDRYDDKVAKVFGLPKLRGVFDQIAIQLAQDRYKRFRGYTRDKMSSHAAQLLVSSNIIKEIFSIPGAPKRPDKSTADYTEDEKNEIRQIVAALGTKQVTEVLLTTGSIAPN